MFRKGSAYSRKRMVAVEMLNDGKPAGEKERMEIPLALL